MSEKIIVKINDAPKIIVHFGEQGLSGVGGVTDHALLTHLGYSESGHTDFQKKLNYIANFKAFEIE